ncbi:hypothetical protein GMOD_00007217 [Pyrenophora seminiperda CCB06]|uniref:Uncharacterized protein n=1 Tax=Pyrenophora seminiperda CCB06 TaxID=1302712 RepID=A0A3M7MCP3_9PLEO|nr:hypothetical protein GMOD_00007217 [Pyrenophora seminiperda CCB06]
MLPGRQCRISHSLCAEPITKKQFRKC